MVSNFSYFKCGGCELKHEIYGSQEKLDGMARRMGVEVLGRVPILGEVSEDCDLGRPTLATGKGGEVVEIFDRMAEVVAERTADR